jgi:16S rRNA (guanine527-N7)-methyltransferase
VASPELGLEARRHLTEVLGVSRQLGFLGPGEVAQQVDRSLAFFRSAPFAPSLAVDLGTGGGLPGLVLALCWPASQWAMVESNQRRAGWLEDATKTLGIDHRVSVLCERAEVAARGPLRHQAQLVTARSFAPPAPTAECAAPLLAVGGCLLVAEPPGGDSSRWPSSGLSQLDLELVGVTEHSTSAGPVTISQILCLAPCSDRFPRRVGVPAKRPLFRSAPHDDAEIAESGGPYLPAAGPSHTHRP